MKHQTTRRAAILLPVLVLLDACSSEPDRKPAPAPRAVTVTKQLVRSPARKLRIAGTAAPWKQETLSFQVGGRIVWVIEPERLVSGPSVDEDFRPGRDGTVIARIDPERHQSALDSAHAHSAAIEAQLKATREQLESVLPQDQAKADAELKRTRENRDRLQRAVERNAVAGTELTNAQAAFETARAAVESVRGQMRSKRSDLEGLKAQVTQAKEAVKKAEFDLRDTELRAPFDGRVTQVAVVPGALVQTGSPVAELVMMDPIKVELTVSTRLEREIGDGDAALVFPRGSATPIVANLYQRDSIADSATRTVRVTFICRNPEVTNRPEGVDVIEDAFPLIQFPTGNTRK